MFLKKLLPGAGREEDEEPAPIDPGLCRASVVATRKRTITSGGEEIPYAEVILQDVHGHFATDSLFLWNPVARRQDRARFRLAQLLAAAGVPEGGALSQAEGRQVFATVAESRHDPDRRFIRDYAPVRVWGPQPDRTWRDEKDTPMPGFGETSAPGLHVASVERLELRTSVHGNDYLKVLLQDEEGCLVSDALFLWADDRELRGRAIARLGQLRAAAGVPDGRPVSRAEGRQVLVTVAMPPSRKGQRLVRGYARPGALDPDWDMAW